MALPVGYDNFAQIRELGLDFVDKSLFIKEIFEDVRTAVGVFTRPRRFGKTLNMSMLQHFLAAEAYGAKTKGLFNDLKIAAYPEIMQHQGKFPVVFVTFKDIKDSNFEPACQKLAWLMREVYQSHRYLLESPALFKEDKIFFEEILSAKFYDTPHLCIALRSITDYLFKHHHTKPWVLIDEYDTPLQSAYVHQYYEPMVELMRGMFGSALKTNPYLHRAVITGILRIAKESLFSGVNHLEVYSLLRSEYSHQFGFTEDEVTALLDQAQLAEKSAEIKHWYNGYQAGLITIYNPWSIVNCIKRKGELIPYWVNTSDNKLIQTLLIEADPDIKESFEKLLQDQAVKHIVSEDTVFGNLKNNHSGLWSLLFMSGYLKITDKNNTEFGLSCQLKIPNIEVHNLYRQLIAEWLSGNQGIERYNQFINYLLTGNIPAFEMQLKETLERVISTHDLAKNPEAFYHGFMLGLTASLCKDKRYELSSNREIGYGRCDFLILSHDEARPSILLEFKRISPDENLDHLTKKLEAAAEAGLTQIEVQNYAIEAQKRGNSHVIRIAIAFCGKRFVLKSAL